MKPKYLKLFEDLYQNGINEQELDLYIKLSQIGDHFDYYVFGHNPNAELIKSLYENNEIFRNFVNKKDKRTVMFFTKYIQLYESTNVIFDETDFEQYSDLFLNFTVSCIIQERPLDYKFYRYFHKRIHRIIADNFQLYLIYFKAILPYLTVQEQDKKINWFIKYHINNIKSLLELNITEENKKKIKTSIMMYKLKEEV